jgi:hypothetical protein
MQSAKLLLNSQQGGVNEYCHERAIYPCRYSAYIGIAFVFSKKCRLQAASQVGRKNRDKI